MDLVEGNIIDWKFFAILILRIVSRIGSSDIRIGYIEWSNKILFPDPEPTPAQTS